MADQAELIHQATVLNHEAGSLETQAGQHQAIGDNWQAMSDTIFNNLADKQATAGWSFYFAHKYARDAKKKRKEASKLERKAKRLSRKGRHAKGFIPIDVPNTILNKEKEKTDD